ncbi:MAG TPA: biotin/lipoyl-binding protein, partial [Woeseiaceae bacterium]|nr:biotin/lipoyl-binding protein [Woeseiaceae bacterium]
MKKQISSRSTWSRMTGSEAADFAPDIVRVQQQSPSPLPRAVLYAMLALFGTALVWAFAGRLDVVAVAEGKLVPQSFLKIVQPAESGIVRDILVREGEEVTAGQVLVRMDARLSDADGKTLFAEMQRKRL